MLRDEIASAMDIDTEHVTMQIVKIASYIEICIVKDSMNGHFTREASIDGAKRDMIELFRLASSAVRRDIESPRKE